MCQQHLESQQCQKEGVNEKMMDKIISDANMNYFLCSCYYNIH